MASSPLKFDAVPGRRAAVVAVVGPDGAGKSTLISLTAGLLRVKGARVMTKHWRPHLFPALGVLCGKGVDAGGAPRRIAGRFRWLRLAYYWLDYSFGSWLLHRRNRACGPDIILYDRCALDVTVDPLRYGLPSPLGTGLLWWAAPGPDLVICLHDDSERIAARKGELPAQEIRELLQRWLGMMRRGAVQLCLRVDRSPAETAAELESRLVGFLEDYYVTDGRGGGFAILRSSGMDRFALPTKVASLGQTLAAYSPTTVKHRLAWKAWGVMRAVGLEGLVSRQTLEPSARLDALDWRGWTREMERRLGEGRLWPAFRFPPQFDSRRVGALLVRPDGSVAAYAKMAWDERGRTGLKREAERLLSARSSPPRAFRMPQLFLQGCFDNRDYLIVEALPANSRQSPIGWEAGLATAAEEIRMVGMVRRRLEDLVWWRALNGLPEPWPNITSLLAREEPKDGYWFGGRHGDFTPWNMRRHGGLLWIFDWELASAMAPAAEDLVRFVLAAQLWSRNRSVISGVNAVLRVARAEGIELPAIALVLANWKVEKQAWYEYQVDEMAAALMCLRGQGNV